MPRIKDEDIHEIVDILSSCKSYDHIEYIIDRIRNKFHYVPHDISNIASHFKDVVYHTIWSGRYIPMPYETEVKYIDLIHSLENTRDADKIVHEVFEIYNYVPSCIWVAINGLKERLREEHKLDNIEEE